MTLFSTLALLALIPVIVITLTALRSGGVFRDKAWLVAAIVCGAFTLWSIAAILKEGPLGFWPIHTQSFWGNQVWFDLLMALTMAWVLILPRAKALGMRSPLWLIFILCSGSIGFSAMLARLLYLERETA